MGQSTTEEVYGMNEVQTNIRFRHRRRIALASFIMMSVVINGLLIFGLFIEGATSKLEDMRWLITTGTGLWSTLVLGYYVAASYEQGKMPK